MRISAGRVAGQTHLDHETITRNGGVVTCNACGRVGTRGERGLGNFGTVGALGNDCLLQRGGVENVDRPSEKEIVGGGHFSKTGDDLHCLSACNGLADIEEIADPLANDDVRLCRDGVADVLGRHR